MIRQGEVYDWTSPAGVRRVVVVSDDAWNEHNWPVCVGIVRPGDGSLYLVPMANEDPTGGRALLGSIGAIPPGELAGTPVGMITGPTWDRVRAGLRALLGL